MANPLRAKTFGENLLLIRTLRKINQEEAASRCQIRPSHYGEIERNTVNPRLDTIIKISQGMNVSLNVLLNYGDNEIETIDATSNMILQKIDNLCDRDKVLLLRLADAMEKEM